jgi:hypothetical protein
VRVGGQQDASATQDQGETVIIDGIFVLILIMIHHHHHYRSWHMVVLLVAKPLMAVVVGWEKGD